jgi:hypothetical protein
MTEDQIVTFDTKVGSSRVTALSSIGESGPQLFHRSQTGAEVDYRSDCPIRSPFANRETRYKTGRTGVVVRETRHGAHDCSRARPGGLLASLLSSFGQSPIQAHSPIEAFWPSSPRRRSFRNPGIRRPRIGNSCFSYDRALLWQSPGAIRHDPLNDAALRSNPICDPCSDRTRAASDVKNRHACLKNIEQMRMIILYRPAIENRRIRLVGLLSHRKTRMERSRNNREIGSGAGDYLIAPPTCSALGTRAGIVLSKLDRSAL